MKHLGFSKLIIAAALLLLTSCHKHDEIAFRGVVVGAYQCSMSSISSIPIVGYFVKLETPDSIGRDYSPSSGVTYHNTVILYDPDCRLYKDNVITGTFYLDDTYSRANCTYHLTDVDLPEGVFVDVSVE